MKTMMIANAMIEAIWVGATVYLIVHDHGNWAAATFVAALSSGYGKKSKKQEGEQS